MSVFTAAGDRSHIPNEHRVIYDVLQARLQLIRDNTPVRTFDVLRCDAGFFFAYASLY